jgi:hypothetical protein
MTDIIMADAEQPMEPVNVDISLCDGKYVFEQTCFTHDN